MSYFSLFICFLAGMESLSSIKPEPGSSTDPDVEVIQVKSKTDRVIEVLDLANDDTDIEGLKPDLGHKPEDLSNHELECIKKIMDLEQRMNSILQICDSTKTVKQEKPERDDGVVSMDILPPEEFSSVQIVNEKMEHKQESIWYACIFCSRKFYSDLPSLQAHIKRMHYLQALQMLQFARKDLKEKLLEYWRQKNRSIEPSQVKPRRHRNLLQLEKNLISSFQAQQGKGRASPDTLDKVPKLESPEDDSVIIESKQECFLRTMQQHRSRRHRFRPYTDPHLVSNRCSPMSLPPSSPCPPDATTSRQRCQSQPTAELFSIDESRSLIPPPPAYSAAEMIESPVSMILPPEIYAADDLTDDYSWENSLDLPSFMAVPPPPTISSPQHIRIPSPPPPPSPATNGGARTSYSASVPPRSAAS